MSFKTTIVTLESFAVAGRAIRACHQEADRLGITRKTLCFVSRAQRRYGRDVVAVVAIVDGIAITPAKWRRIALKA